MNHGQLPTVAVTGASGHLGTCLIEMLSNQGYQVLAQYNTYKPNLDLTNVDWIQGDINDQTCLQHLTSHSQVVIHAAGMISISDSENEKLEHVNVNGTGSVIQACLNHPPIRLIYISSSNAVLPPQNPEELFDESRPYNDHGTPYAQSKAKAERLVRQAISTNDLDAIILRPSAIIGPPDFKPSLMGGSIIDFYHNKYKVIPSGGYNCVDVRDVSETIIKAIDTGQKGEVYNVTGEFQTLKTITDTVSKVAGSNQPWFIIPVSMLFILVPVMKLVGRLTKSPQRMTRNSLTTLKYGPRQMDQSKAKRDLNHSSRPFEDSVRDLIDWFKKEKIIQ